MQTLRRQIIELLANREMNARELSQELHIMEKEVCHHLMHIAKSLAAQKKQLKATPFRCLHCGYVFEKRKKRTKPGRCPVCKQGHISQASYRIVAEQTPV